MVVCSLVPAVGVGSSPAYVVGWLPLPLMQPSPLYPQLGWGLE